MRLPPSQILSRRLQVTSKQFIGLLCVVARSAEGHATLRRACLLAKERLVRLGLRPPDARATPPTSTGGGAAARRAGARTEGGGRAAGRNAWASKGIQKPLPLTLARARDAAKAASELADMDESEEAKPSHSRHKNFLQSVADISSAADSIRL
jgi:hypothetical protein